MSTASSQMSDTVSHPVKTRLDYLDGLRGLAALFVVAHHLWRDYITTALPGLEGIAVNWLLYGHLAVDVFIVLSGACLMLPVARSGSLRGGWKTFYKSRARRILPPFYAAVALALALALAKHVLPSLAALAANLLLLQDLLPHANVLDAPLWSVALEWKIYFLFPPLVWLWVRFKTPAVLLVSAIIGYGLTGFLAAVFPALYDALACPWYVFLFGLGMAATDLSVNLDCACRLWLIPALFWGALACLALMLHQWPVTSAGEAPLFVPHRPLIDAAAGILTALALVMLGQESAQPKRSLSLQVLSCQVLSWKPFVFVGTIGYSLYLVHTLFIYRIKDRLVAVFPAAPPFVVIVLDMAIVIAIAYVFHLLCERPFMSKPGKPGKPAVRTEREAEAAAIENPAP